MPKWLIIMLVPSGIGVVFTLCWLAKAWSRRKDKEAERQHEEHKARKKKTVKAEATAN